VPGERAGREAKMDRTMDIVFWIGWAGFALYGAAHILTTIKMIKNRKRGGRL